MFITSLSGINSFSKTVETKAVGSYVTNASTFYNGLTASSGNELLYQLHDLMMSTHKTYTSYDDNGSNGYQKISDADPNDSTKLICFYSHSSINNTWNSGTLYNREHVWPQSLSGGLYGTSGAGGDMQHIRPTIVAINSARGNSKYGELTSGTSISYGGGLVSTYSSSIFEPADAVKGDAARIIMYMYTHYNTRVNLGSSTESSSTTNCGNMPITNVIDGTQTQAFSLLRNWNNLDPVDSLETTRNNVVAGYQGNRNPFIDHPEYADAIWGDGTPSISMPTELSINKGSTGSVVATISNGSGTISYSSSNNNIATVSSTGTVTGIAQGSATITASVVISGTTYSDTCLVSVIDQSATISVTGVSLTPATLSLNVGATSTLTATVTPSDATNKAITFGSSNESVATVSTSGLVTAIAPGTSTISVLTSDGGFSAETALTVNQASATETFTITRSSFPGGALAYATDDAFTATSTDLTSTITGLVDLYSDANMTYMQTKSNAGHNYFYSTSPVPGSISEIKILTNKNSSSSGREWYLYASKVAVTPSNYSSVATLQIKKSFINSETYTLAVSQTSNYQYFYFYTSTTSATMFDSIAIKYVTYSGEADSYATSFLSSTSVCDSSGVNNNITSTLWDNLSTSYSALTNGAKAIIVASGANPSGTTMEQAMARYDYIVFKRSYTDYIGRGILSSPNKLDNNVEEDAFAIMMILGIFGFTTIGGYVLLKKKRK